MAADSPKSNGLKDKELEKILEKRTNELFDSVARISLHGSPGFKDRVLAKAQKQSPRARVSPFWNRALAASFTFAVTAFAFSFWFSKSVFEAPLSQTVALRIDLSKHLASLNDASAANCKIQITLPSGVNFQSEAFGEAAQLSSLELPCGGLNPNDPRILPITVQGSQEGLRSVSVRFVVNDEHEISRATFRIRFKKGTEKA